MIRLKSISLKFAFALLVVFVFSSIFCFLPRGSFEVSEIENKNSIKILSAQSFMSLFKESFSEAHPFGDVFSELEEERYRLKVTDPSFSSIVLRESPVSLVQVQNIDFFQDRNEKYYLFEVRPWNMSYLGRNEEAPLFKFKMYIERLTDNKLDTSIQIENVGDRVANDSEKILVSLKKLESVDSSKFIDLLKSTRPDLVTFKQGFFITLSIITQGIFEYEYKALTTSTKFFVVLLKVITIFMVGLFALTFKPSYDAFIKQIGKRINLRK